MAGSASTATKKASRSTKRKSAPAAVAAAQAMNGASDKVYEGDGRDQIPGNGLNGEPVGAQKVIPGPTLVAPPGDTALADTANGRLFQSEWPIDNNTVLEVVRERKAAFIVFIDQDYRVRWLTSFATSELSQKSKNMITRVRMTAAMPTAHFDHEQRRAWMRMIGEALGLALSEDVEDSKRTLAAAKEFVAARAKEMARMWYVSGSLIAFAVLVSVGFVLFNTFPSIFGESSNALVFDSTIGLAIMCGAVGAEFSILFRLNDLDVDPGAGQSAHRLEAAVRLLMGSFAAMIIVIAVRGDVALGFIDPGTSNGVDVWLIAAIALVAGVSERFVPSILQKVEDTFLDKDTRGDDTMEPAQQLEVNSKNAAST